MDAGQKTDRPPEQIVREVIFCSNAWHAPLEHVLKFAAHTDNIACACACSPDISIIRTQNISVVCEVNLPIMA